MKTYNNIRRGFSLIELLVVMLIIGILAAVALPQYQKAVIKSRAARLESILSSLVTASNVYHLQTGEYPDYFDKLDIDFNLPTGQAICGKNCDNGDFCKKIMGKTVANYLPTVYVYE